MAGRMDGAVLATIWSLKSLPRHQSGLAEAAGSGELFKITMPIEDRLAALKQLELMNINAFSLFDSEDSLIRTVARRELLFRDWD